MCVLLLYFEFFWKLFKHGIFIPIFALFFLHNSFHSIDLFKLPSHPHQCAKNFISSVIQCTKSVLIVNFPFELREINRIYNNSFAFQNVQNRLLFPKKKWPINTHWYRSICCGIEWICVTFNPQTGWDRWDNARKWFC